MLRTLGMLRIQSMSPLCNLWVWYGLIAVLMDGRCKWLQAQCTCNLSFAGHFLKHVFPRKYLSLIEAYSTECNPMQFWLGCHSGWLGSKFMCDWNNLVAGTSFVIIYCTKESKTEAVRFWWPFQQMRDEGIKKLGCLVWGACFERAFPPTLLGNLYVFGTL